MFRNFNFLKSLIGHYQSIIELPEEVLEEVDKYPFSFNLPFCLIRKINISETEIP
jgi:hypothetical protein